MPSPTALHRAFAVAAAAACLMAGALLGLWGPALPQARAAAAVAVDQSGGYAAKMLEKIVTVWAPPPALKGDFVVQVKVRVDGRGAVTDCTPVRASGMEALDISACGAVRQGGGYGTPPYAQPLDVHLAFWTGTPKGKPRVTAPSSEEALRAEVRARTKAEAALSDARAAAAEARARERAEALAQGRAASASAPAAPPLPPAPAAPDKAGRPALSKTEDRNTAPAAAQDAPAPAAPAPAAASARKSAADTERSDAAARRRYLRAVSWRLREHIVIPAETAPGEYRVPVRLEVDPQTGAIKDFSVLQDTGDKLLDRYVRLGIRRAGSVPPPPPGLGGRLELTLVLRRP
ncbi:energy transducer TonB [Desulfovibrio legallii]|uniref:TonB C terminal n=1 Tax=Desulfovibrio legallii TaxID=571438 RepID=A0A1G7ID69_9BACT|nr:energy transducer TonB [Desulfovibrio legallii]SDF10528.1 TonB C terminal [Desulfovibrio legallii]